MNGGVCVAERGGDACLYSCFVILFLTFTFKLQTHNSTFNNPIQDFLDDHSKDDNNDNDNDHDGFKEDVLT